MSPAVTWLFVPGDRPERFAKAAASGADEVILDLEDAVAPGAKETARSHLRDWLGTHRAWVRVNDPASPELHHDLAALTDVAALAGVMVAKAETPESLTTIGERLRVPVVALVESARGLDRARAIASAPGVSRLAFGSLDYALDLGAAHTRDALASARQHLVLASRLAGLAAPVDGVSVEVADPEQAADDATYCRMLGFGGKLCIHPRQVAAVREAFAPSAADLAWAHRVIAAADGAGAARVDGAMVDRPVLERARRLLLGAGPDTDPDQGETP